jgi:hypothetical protein
MVLVDVHNIGVPHISYFSSNILCIYTIFILQSVHVFRLHINLKTCGKLFLCNFFFMFLWQAFNCRVFGFLPFVVQFCWFRGAYCLPLLNFAQLYSAELGSGGCFGILNVINSR